MKRISILAACLVMVLATESRAAGDVGEGDQPMRCETCDTGGDDWPPPPTTTGYEIRLPIWNISMFPTNWTVYDSAYAMPAGTDDCLARATVQWGWGNAIYFAKYSMKPAIYTFVDPGSGYVPLVHVSGYFSQPNGNALVRGTIQLESLNSWSPPGPDDVILALQVESAPGQWTDVFTKPMAVSTSYATYAEIEAYLPTLNDNVRFEVRVKKWANEERFYNVYVARMFGANCYQDFANPGSCL